MKFKGMKHLIQYLNEEYPKNRHLVRIAIDFDGTLSADPERFKIIAELAGKENVFILTARPQDMREETQRKIDALGFTEYSELIMFPGSYSFDDLDFKWEELIAFKAKVCQELGISMLYEDDVKYKAPVEATGTLVILMEGGKGEPA